MLKHETKQEMYEYLLSNNKQSGEYVDSNFQVYIVSVIKKLSKRLFFKTELYIGKSNLKRDKDYKIVREKYYKSLSNRFIYDVLHELNTDYDYIKSTAEGESDSDTRILQEQLEKIKYDDYMSIAETGSNDRKKLIRACKMYKQHKEIELYAKNKYETEYNMGEESWLAEQVLGKYSEKQLNSELKARSQSTFNQRDNQKYAGQIRPDIIVWNRDNLIIIDVKVYETIIKKNRYGTEKYGYNDNRFQVNSYIGRCLDSDDYKNRQNRYGVILHIVDKELYEKCKDADNTDLTIEQDRPIKLWLIEDKGLDYIFEEYARRINELI